ncbi:hypothetical protein ABZ958_36325 [Streptomyces sp. NPDC046237]|uniref:hypothetical protein n=1 Tax=Streptomyces sp. NPDC046237 TaxID=3154914 RepID=UPI0033C41A39
MADVQHRAHLTWVEGPQMHLTVLADERVGEDDPAPTSEDHDGRQEEVEVRETGTFHVTQAQLPRLQAFCSAVTAKIDAVMDGATWSRAR